ncbi:hypothetical protein [Thiocapsa sp.]|uniref:hypothetical protein n=1 Tax=Thiocapsa sp. TaxID=2024551 RepID=UPI002C952DBD|nr:hypothetical protein [Thiocapsa sp.]HSO81208.1 hypothetical protein [Thiocapsa sp.]
MPTSPVGRHPHADTGARIEVSGSLGRLVLPARSRRQGVAALRFCTGRSSFASWRFARGLRDTVQGMSETEVALHLLQRYRRLAVLKAL